MINDFMQEVSDRIELKFKEMFILSDNGDRAILADGRLIALPSTMINFGMKFKFSTWQEWLDEMAKAKTHDLSEVYPFMFVNSIGVQESDDIVTFPTIIFAVPAPAGVGVKTTDRDSLSFRPLLNNFHRLFYDALHVNTAFSIADKGERVNHYFYGKYGLNGGDGNMFPTKTDCIEIKNLKLRIYKN